MSTMTEPVTSDTPIAHLVAEEISAQPQNSNEHLPFTVLLLGIFFVVAFFGAMIGSNGIVAGVGVMTAFLTVAHISETIKADGAFEG